MKVFRLSRKKYPTELSGKGAAAFGARWNSQGIEMVYTAESRALAMAEVFVHLSLAMMPDESKAFPLPSVTSNYQWELSDYLHPLKGVAL